MVEEFKKFVIKNVLLKKEDKTLITVSGGRDSVVLCELFHKAKFPFAIAHCNFQLRGKEANDDEVFVKELTSKYKVDFFCKRFKTEKFATQNKLSIQEAARVLRYEWFEEIRSKNAFDLIATAHHKDDELETFFINLIRGTGIAGLHGILPKRGKIIRPLLFASRTEINSFVKKNKLQFREDRSNASDKYLRNKIRHKVLPLFEEMNPSFRNTLTEEIARLSEVEKIYNHFIDLNKKQVFNNNILSVSALKKVPFASILLYEILKKYDFNADVSAEVFSSLDSESGKQFFSPTYRLVKDRQRLIITKRNTAKTKKVFSVSQKEKKLIEPLKIELLKVKNSDDFIIPNDSRIACLDFEKLKFPLQIRKWKEGDFFFPLGMKKKKKLSDFFTDIKFSIPDKENTWLLCSDGDIVYVIGKRIDERYKVGKETKTIYLVRCIDKNV
ncbi:MAG: tRNA lysidine(34) synthetase TilS [Bacteroidia bacterium]